LIFYKHSDGYPEGTLPLLNKLLKWVKDGRIRDNPSQAAGWLIIIGHREYANMVAQWRKADPSGTYKGHGSILTPGDKEGHGWKVGSIEPTTCFHGDIEYAYKIDLKAKKITYIKVSGVSPDFKPVVPSRFYTGPCRGPWVTPGVSVIHNAEDFKPRPEFK
jgi:hypothetical protein